MTDLARRFLFQSAAAGTMLALFTEAAQADTSGALFVIAELNSKPDQVEQLRDLLVPFAKGAAKEPGCIHYSLLEVVDQPGRFLTFETWTNRAALDAHMKTPALAAAGPKLVPILAKPFTQIFMHKLVG
jgi:quinol monooxygenase YgiN